jgi:hypothetical protein
MASDKEILDSLGIPTTERTLVGETASTTKKSDELIPWLKEKLGELSDFKDMHIGSTVGGVAGAALGSLPPALLFSGGSSPFIGGAGGAAAGQYIEDLIRGKDLDIGGVALEGLKGAAGPVLGKIGMGLGALGAGKAVITASESVGSKLGDLLLKYGPSLGGGAWGSYNYGTGGGVVGALAGLLGSGLIRGGNLAYQAGSWNPFASGLGTFLATSPDTVITAGKDIANLPYIFRNTMDAYRQEQPQAEEGEIREQQFDITDIIMKALTGKHEGEVSRQDLLPLLSLLATGGIGKAASLGAQGISEAAGAAAGGLSRGIPALLGRSTPGLNAPPSLPSLPGGPQGPLSLPGAPMGTPMPPSPLGGAPTPLPGSTAIPMGASNSGLAQALEKMTPDVFYKLLDYIRRTGGMR